MTIDLRDREIATLDDLLSVYSQHQTLQTTGKMLDLEVVVSPQQSKTIHRLLRNQSQYADVPDVPHVPQDRPVRWCGMTITTAP